MNKYFSDFGLPKEYSKKKKFNLMIAKMLPIEGEKFEINTDDSRMYLTFEDAAKAEILEHTDLSLLELKEPKRIAICDIEISASEVNDKVVFVTPHGDPLDAKFNPDDLSFSITLRDKEISNMAISVFEIEKLEIHNEETGPVIKELQLRPVIA